MKEQRLLQVGVLGAGPIAQFAHLEACRKARNAQLVCICDVAEDLLQRAAQVHQVERLYTNYDDMLADDDVQAVIIATSDAFHVPMALKAVDAGKHVLVEKPLGVSLEPCRRLQARLRETALVFQIGHMKRFDPGIAFARDFIRHEIGEVLAVKAWYCDSTYRYTVTDNLQPIPHTSSQALKPGDDPKSNRRRYYLLTHGSHLVDTARYLGGEIVSCQARLVEKFGAYCWFVDVEFANGANGHLDLTIAVRMDWHEGFQVYGEFGSVIGKTYNPWFLKSSDVECFSVKDGQYRRALGADAHTYRLQVEGFADTILHDQPMRGAGIEDGVASVQAMLAIGQSVETGQRVRLDEVSGEI
jgi:predicted dehydrogenase